MNTVRSVVGARYPAGRFGVVDVPVLTAGEISTEFAVGAGVLLLVGVLLAFWTEGILRLLWTLRGDAPDEEIPDWVSRFVQALGAAFVAATVVVLTLDWFGYAGL